MEYPRLRKALNAYCAWLQSNAKANVQVRTGALKNSIRVFCTVDGVQYKMNLNAKRYWKWIREALPWNDMLENVGLPKETIHYKYGPDVPPYARYSFLRELKDWQELLNNAFREDIEAYLGIKNQVKVSEMK